MTRFRFHVCFLCRLLFLGKSGRRKGWLGWCLLLSNTCPPVDLGLPSAPPPDTCAGWQEAHPVEGFPDGGGGAKASSSPVALLRPRAEHRLLSAVRPDPVGAGEARGVSPPSERAGWSEAQPGNTVSDAAITVPGAGGTGSIGGHVVKHTQSARSAARLTLSIHIKG